MPFGYQAADDVTTPRAAFAIFLIVSVAHASTLAPIVPIADAMTLAAAPGRFQYGWVRGGASAAFVVGAVGAGQVVQATNLDGIVWMNGTLLALAAAAALWLPRNALDRPMAPRHANVRALFAAPGFLPLMALAALVMSSHALHDGFEGSCHENLALAKRKSEDSARVQAAVAARQFCNASPLRTRSVLRETRLR
jgi:hypothetical protein